MTESPEGFTLFSVLDGGGFDGDPDAAANAFDAVVAEWDSREVVLRGIYDVSGLRADGTAMLWLHGPRLEDLQAALRALRATELLEGAGLTWSAAGVHRPAEFNRAHVPGFLRGERARNWLTVYPFVRSYEWYLLPEEERSTMLREHGMKGAAFRGVVANTVAAFALGDYEWLLPMEADEVTELVDMMRDLRYTEARRHVREELPFYTGRRVTTREIAEVLGA
ncbi:MAG: chlorite dismutase family protein [Demequinaceae bacterium]|nr:chlorite dismutase family protein [Demequinaceae bacterium]